MSQSKSDKKSLLRQVDKLLGIPDNKDVQNQYEIEARIGYYRGKTKAGYPRFVSDIDNADFYRILGFFLKHEGDLFKYLPQEVSERTETWIKDNKMDLVVPHNPDIVYDYTYEFYNQNKKMNVRESFVAIPNAKIPVFYSTKEKLQSVDFTNHFTRVSKAKENELGVISDWDKDPRIVPQGNSPKSLRVKQRWSFVVIDYSIDNPAVEALKDFRVDLTHVTGWYLNAENQQVPVDTHEIELELYRPQINNSEKEFWPAIQFMLQLLQQTEIPVTAATITNVKNRYNDLFKDEIQSIQTAKRKKIPRWTFAKWKLFNPVNRPINIKLHNLKDPVNLAVTDKADGERRLLLVDKGGAYLLNPPNGVSRYLNPVLPADHPLHLNPTAAEFLDGTVFDGEYVQLDNGDYKYLAFDILIDRGGDIRGMKFKDRYEMLKFRLNNNELNPSVGYKKFYTPEHGPFYQRVNDALDAIPGKPYDNDGLIFNNINDAYLSNVKNVYKWKPPEQLTIDFRIRQTSPTEFYLGVGNDIKSSQRTAKKCADRIMAANPDLNAPEVLFMGTGDHPFDGKIVVNPPEINGTPLGNDQVVEMAWDFKNQTFVPQRIRFDKPRPNNLSTACDIWADIMEPITETTIRGKDLKVMRKLHNVIKRNMLKERCTGSAIVDIGSGRGGDISKWIGTTSSVLAVEPSQENLKELVERLFAAGFIPNEGKNTDTTKQFILNDSTKQLTVNTMQGYGQDTDKIFTAAKKVLPSKNKVCVTIFNALTFFFEKEEALDALVDTVDKLLPENGIFMGMVMDGALVRERFNQLAPLKAKLETLGEDQYYNLDTNKRINEKHIAKFHVDLKWKLASKDKAKLKEKVKELKRPDTKEITGDNWIIVKKSPFTKSPYGNKIVIDLGSGTIVQNQTEYLVDFNEFVKKLKAKNILYDKKLSYHLSEEPSLSPSQNGLNTLYRTFVFKKESYVELFPATGGLQKDISDLQQKLTLKKRFLKKLQETLPMQKGEQLASSLEQEKNLKESIQEIESKIKELTFDYESTSKSVFIPLSQLGSKKVTVVKEKPVIGAPKTKPLPETQPLTFYSDKNITFKALEQPVPQLLPEKRAPLVLNNTYYERVGTIIGNCPLVAIMRAGLSKYYGDYNEKPRSLATEDKDARVQLYRKTKRGVTNVIRDNHDKLELLNKYYPDWESASKVLKKCAMWPWLGLWGILANIFKHNIAIVTMDNPFTNPIVYNTGDKHPRTMVLFNYNGVFDVLSQRTSDGKLVTSFQTSDITTNSLITAKTVNVTITTKPLGLKTYPEPTTTVVGPKAPKKPVIKQQVEKTPAITKGLKKKKKIAGPSTKELEKLELHKKQIAEKYKELSIPVIEAALKRYKSRIAQAAPEWRQKVPNYLEIFNGQHKYLPPQKVWVIDDWVVFGPVEFLDYWLNHPRKDVQKMLDTPHVIGVMIGNKAYRLDDKDLVQINKLGWVAKPYYTKGTSLISMKPKQTVAKPVKKTKKKTKAVTVSIEPESQSDLWTEEEFAKYIGVDEDDGEELIIEESYEEDEEGEIDYEDEPPDDYGSDEDSDNEEIDEYQATVEEWY